MAVQPTVASNMANSPRPAEGYSKEIFGQADATTLPTGITEIGQTQLAGNAAGQGNTIQELFSALLVEMRQQTAIIAALREPLTSDIRLRVTP